MAPLGYGEMAPRDLESAMFGSVLMKPDMSHISSEPFIYEDNETYIAVNYNWSNLEEKIDYVLSDYNNVRERLVQNMRKKYQEKYGLSNLVLHFYNVISNLDGVEIT
jgi:molecular chaperone GrpE (heat shock protein)